MRSFAWALAALLPVAACHETPAPPPQPSPAALAQAAAARVDRIAQACARVSSCAHAHDAPRERDPAACVEWWMQTVRGDDTPFAKCLAAARTCAAVDACARERGDPVAARYCSAHPGVNSGCDGDKLVTCSEDDPDESRAVDCASFGATCGELQAGGLASKACISAKLCPPGAPESRCDGKEAVITCHEGAADRVACPRGIACEEHKGTSGEQIATCEPPNHVHCEQVGQRRCDGNRVVWCAPHGPFGEPRDIDCAAFGLACEKDASGKAACVLASQTDKPCEPGARCDGEALTFCAAGRRLKVSCEGLGFGPCDPDGHGLEASCKAGTEWSSP